jgi:hypothetical protein
MHYLVWFIYWEAKEYVICEIVSAVFIFERYWYNRKNAKYWFLYDTYAVLHTVKKYMYMLK